VFILGLEDGIFPHMRSMTEPEEMEEERRLAYVGITRAQQRLYLTHAWARMIFGQTQYNPPSRFLDELPTELVEEGNGSRGTGRRLRSTSFGSSGSAAGFGGRNRLVETALAPTGPTPSGAEGLGLRIGDDVNHRKWGEGVVLDLRGSGDKTEVVVRFPSVGEKTLLLAWAPLEKLG
jgi:DNA helicase-2/ATP-dependent DNA helicase PcrA